MTFLKTKTTLVLILFIAIGFQACSDDGVQIEQPEKPVVQVIAADSSEQTVSVIQSATLEPWKQYNIASNSPGRIANIFVEEGDAVEAGDRLVQMQDNQLQQARIAYETAKREYERLVPLHKQGAVTSQQLELAQTELENAEINLDILEENTLLRAQSDGIITQKWFEAGEYYLTTPTEDGPPGIVQLMQLDTLKLVLNVNESMLQYVEVGQVVAVTVDALPNEKFESTISRVFPTVDPATRSFRVEVAINNSNRRLKPGLFARAELQTQTLKELFVPREALLRGTSANSQDVLFLVDDSTAVRQVVTVGSYVNEWVSIKEGVQTGQLVVVKGKQRLENGTKVEAELYQ